MIKTSIADFLLWWHKWSTFSSSSTSCCRSLVYGTHPATKLADEFATPQKWQHLVTHLPVAFVEIVRVPSAHISHVPKPWWFKRPHPMMTSHLTLSEHPPCAHIFCIHVNQAIHHKDIWIPFTFYDLLMNTPALLKCNYAGTCI